MHVHSLLKRWRVLEANKAYQYSRSRSSLRSWHRSAYYLQKSENGGFISISACSHGCKNVYHKKVRKSCNAEIMDAENSSILMICKYSCFVCMSLRRKSLKKKMRLTFSTWAKPLKICTSWCRAERCYRWNIAMIRTGNKIDGRTELVEEEDLASNWNISQCVVREHSWQYVCGKGSLGSWPAIARVTYYCRRRLFHRSNLK